MLKEQLSNTTELTPACVTRLLDIYGSRAVDIAALQKNEYADVYLDEEQTVLAAEVAFSIRHEFAADLIDIMHRRMMIGLNRDQGLPMAEEIALIAADESGWDRSERERQLQTLHAYSERFKP